MPENKPETEGRYKGKCYIIAHCVVAEAAGQPSVARGVTHDEVMSCSCLPQSVDPLPEACKNTGPDKTAHIFFFPYAFHSNKRQDKTLVDAGACVQQGIKGVFRQNHADGCHKPQTVKKRTRCEPRKHALSPCAAVVQQQKNKTDRRHDLARTVAYGKGCQRKPERPEKTKKPAFGRVMFIQHNEPRPDGRGPLCNSFRQYAVQVHGRAPSQGVASTAPGRSS